MAKPKHADGLGNRSIDSQQPLVDNLTYLRHQDPSSSSSSSSSSCSASPSPSSAVLSALAIIAASPTVAGNPLPLQSNPPVFLCPSIERDLTSVPQNIAIIPPIPAHVAPSVPVPTPTYHHLTRRIADKYAPGMDNRWRKADEWSLYGSACCSGTPSPNVNDVQSWPSQSSPLAQPSSVPVELDATSLPAGWHQSTGSGSGMDTTIIVIISIVLAVILCAFMIACVCWRRTKKKRDIELKLRHKLKADDESEYGDQEKEAQNRMRVWARATARWKSHIRQSARRRRKRQATVSRGPRPQSPTPSIRPDGAAVSLPRPSRQSSPSPSPAENTESIAITTASDISQRAGLPSDSQSQPEASLPPAYNPGVTQRSHSTIHCHPNDLNSSSLLSQRSSPRSDGTPPLISHAEPAPYIPPAAGHVATDDKSHLRSLGEQASAPPVSATSTTSEIHSVVLSVPTWDDISDELEGYPELEPYSPSVHIPPNFPPPPSKAMMASSYHDDADTPTIGTDVDGPLAPSAPPADYLDVEPSAPSLEDEAESEAIGTIADHVSNGRPSHSHPLVVPGSLTFRTYPSSASHGILPSYFP